jgi:membrane associated rhomboid family serine protease
VRLGRRPRPVESCTVETTTCFHHTDRPTGRACTRCGRPACPDCLRDAAVGSHCFECVREARPPAAERARQRVAGAGPVVTKAIVWLNVGVFLLTATSAGGSLMGEGISRLHLKLGLDASDVHNGQLYRLVTSAFIHFGIFHIGFNMALLYRFGEMLEAALGRIRFAALYLAALLSGSFGALLLSPNALTGGASGAVFGIFGAVAIGLHQRGVDVWQSGVGGLIVVNLVLSFVIPGIAIGGHLGGLAGGFVVGAFMLRVPTTRRSVIDGVLLAGVVSSLAVAGSLWAAAR